MVGSMTMVVSLTFNLQALMATRKQISHPYLGAVATETTGLDSKLQPACAFARTALLRPPSTLIAAVRLSLTFLTMNSTLRSPTGDDRYLSSASHIDTARCNQPNTNPGNKRGQGTEEEVTKCDCRHNLDVGEWCERRSFGIGEGVHQQHLIYRTRQN